MPDIASAADGITHVFIRNLEMLAHIGVHGHEQGKPQPIRINVDLAVKGADGRDDRLEHVVNYETLTQTVRAIVAHGHVNLAETLAFRIADAALEDARVVRARVRVEKLHAVAGAESGGVEIERVR